MPKPNVSSVQAPARLLWNVVLGLFNRFIVLQFVLVKNCSRSYEPVDMWLNSFVKFVKFGCGGRKNRKSGGRARQDLLVVSDISMAR